MINANRECLLSTRLFSVERREYPRDGLPPIRRDVVVHPGAVVILPLLGDDRIVMIRNYRHTVEQELLELPAGTREPDEQAIETARRELEEETGYRAGSIEPLTEFFASPGILTEQMHTFVAHDLTHVGQRLEDNERITVAPVDTQKAWEMLAGGELRDAKTIATLAVYFARTRG